MVKKDGILCAYKARLENIKEEILIISRQKNNVKGKLISFSLGMNENNTDQNSFRTINGLKFKTTKICKKMQFLTLTTPRK